ncbi:MAG: autotransporter outer membrane beta-barrel domain-containing protein [Synergistaceae bacterium]|nr:autotransporter outer membrane beta-barrel domain-containing protein [Synergistaceae bacterium]
MKTLKIFIASVLTVVFIFGTSSLACASGLMDITNIMPYKTGQSPASTIYFGKNSKGSGLPPIQWRVLAVNEAADTYGNNGVLLLSQNTLYTQGFGGNQWGTSNIRGSLSGLAGGNTPSTGVAYSSLTDDSFAKKAFVEAEYNAILDTEHNAGGGYKGKDIRSIDRLFLLSIDEVGLTYFKNKKDRVPTAYSTAEWWLRSPGGSVPKRYPPELDYLQYTVDIFGNTCVCQVAYFCWDVRPALNLDPNKVLFLSAAEATKSDGTNYDKNSKSQVSVGDGFALANYDGSKGWKVTLLDAYDETTNQNGIKAPTDVTVTQDGHIGNKTVNELAQETIDHGKKEMDLSSGLTYRNCGGISVSYKGKDTKADFVSAIAATGDGTVDNPYAYENYAKISANASEQARTLPLGNLDSNKEYTLLIFAEQIGKDTSGRTDYMTDYASETQKFKINNGVTTYVGTLKSTYKDNELTAKLGSNFNLSFDAGEYMTGLNVVGDSTITAGSSGTTLKRNVDIAEGATLKTVNAFTFKGVNTIDGTLTGKNVTLSGGTTTVGTNGKIENNLKVASDGALSLDANKYGVDDGVKNVTSNEGTIELTGTGTAGVLGKHITNGGKVVLSTGTSFAEGVKIIGGDVELENDVEFSATNLDGINNLTAPTTANEAAIYNFALKIEDNKGISQHDQINLSGVATGHIKLGDVVYLPGSSDDTHWTVNESKQVQYLSNIVTGTNIVIDNTLGVAMPGSDGASYFFSQAYDPNDASKPLIGYLNVKRGNTYTLWEVVGSDTREDGSDMSPEQKKEARSVNIYTLNANGSGAYVAGKDFPALTRADGESARTLTIKGLGTTAFNGGGHTGIDVGSGNNTLTIDGVTEISGWKDGAAFTVTGGNLRFTGDNTLELKDGIMNKNGGSVIFDQDVILTGKLFCQNTGNYLNKETRTLTVADISNLLMTQLDNNGILNLGDGSAADKTLGTQINYVPYTTGEATLNFNGSGTITATETITQKVVNVNTNLNMQKSLTTNGGTNVADGKNLTISASNLNSNVVANGANQSGRVTLKDGTLGNYTITGGAIVIDGAVTASADNLKSNKGITNASNTLTLNGGMLIDNVYDADGTLKIGGTVEIASDKTVENKVVINGTNTLTANANSLKSATAISNASGIFKVTGGTILAGVTGAGTTEIGDGTNSAEVTLGNNASIAGKVAIKAQSKFIADFTKLSGSIDNAGTFVVTGSTPITIGKQITGVGTTQFGDGSSALAVTFEGTGQIDGNAKIAANSQLTLSDFSNIGGDLTVDANGKLIITANGPINKEIKGLGTTQVGDDSNHVDVTLGDIGSIFGDVAINAQSKLTVEDFIRIGGIIDNAGKLVLTGANMIDWKILGATGITEIDTAQDSDTVKIGKNGAILGSVALNNGELQLNADKYGTDIKLSSFVGGTLHFTDGLIMNDVVASGTTSAHVILDSGVSLAKDVKIDGGENKAVNVEFNEDIEFIAGNLVNVNDFTSKGAKYTFGANVLKTSGEPYVTVDKITLAGEVTGNSKIKLGNINLTGSDEGLGDDSWKVYTWKTVQYIEANSLNDVLLDGEVTTTLPGGTAYTFQQGYEVNSDGTLSDVIKHGYVSVKRGNTYTLAEVVGLDNWEDKSKHGGVDMTDEQRNEARGVDIYTLNANNSSGDTYSATYDLGEFQTKTGETNRSLLVRAFSDSPLKFLGGGHAGIQLNKTTDVLEVRNISEISGWKDAQFARNNGTIKFTGKNSLVLSDKITGTGITQIGDVEEQNIVTKVELKDNSEIQGRVKILDNGQLVLDDFSKLKNSVTNDGTIFFSGNEIATAISSSYADVKGIVDLQKAAKIAAEINNQNIILREGYSKVDQASYIANNDLTFNGGGFDFRKQGVVQHYVVKNINFMGDGNLMLGVDLANKAMDTLNVADGGTVTGSGKLHITALTLLSDAKQNKTNIAFSETDALKGHVVSDVTHVASDMWKYLVAYDKETGEFAFTKSGRSEPDKPEVSETVMSISDTAQALNVSWLNNINNLQKRLGDLRGGEASNTGWARFQRSNDDHNGARKLNVSGNLYQLGYDVALKNNTAARGYFGLSVEHFDGSQSYKIGGGDVKSTSLSAYYTKIYDSGHYFDFIFRYGRYESDTTSYDAGLSTKLDYGMNGVTLSGEYGYRANIGKNGFYFEPQAEVIYGYLAGAKKTSSRGILADIDSTNHFVTRLGVALGKKVKNFNYYLRGSYYHDFAGSTNILYGDASYKQDSARNWWELSLGGGWNMTDASYFYAELTKHFKDVSNSINFNLGFRFTL